MNKWGLFVHLINAARRRVQHRTSATFCNRASKVSLRISSRCSGMEESVVSVKYESDVERDSCDEEDKVPITTTTKNALITTQLGPCDVYPHRVKVSIVGIGKIGMACAIAILMRRLASEVCLIDHDANKASAEAEDIQHAGVFLGSPLVTGTSDISMVKESAVVIISACESAPGEEPNVKHNFKMFKTIIPGIARFACKSVLLVVTQPTDVMSYITWKLSGFPSNRVLGTGTLLDSARLQDFISRRLNVARSSVSCMTIGAQGNMAVPVWSNVHVGGMKLRDINPRIGEEDDPEKWYEINEAMKNSGKQLDEKKGLNCWGHALCTAEIVDAIVRNTKVVLPASTHIHSCAHGTDKDVYMSVPCVIGREGVYCTVRQKLTEPEKSAVQTCADSIRGVLRECGILQDSQNDSEE
ncbi:L-lactate dehydrogenase isoform X1 [Nomia melanderi]|uniref:L-lactate dehydrogenase isoform X1 n=2 Tax=Nomia melanderi TaxID=2448451 RepID=UPI003FCD8953